MEGPINELNGLHVSIDDVIYMPTLEAPEEHPHPFVYFVTIHNASPEAVTIRARKWVITQDNGEKIVVEGEGVVNQTPRIVSGGNFTYNSYHVVSDNGEVAGAFFAETESGNLVYTRIPEFSLKIPVES